MTFLLPQQDSGDGGAAAAAAAAQAEADKKAAELKAKKDRELAYGQETNRAKTLAPTGTNKTAGDSTGANSSETLAGGSTPLISYTLLNNKLG